MDMDITKILAKHSKWSQDFQRGKRADLQDLDLQDANLQDANLQDADLQHANLRDARNIPKAKGYTVILPCDNINSTGHYAGHDIEETE